MGIQQTFNRMLNLSTAAIALAAFCTTAQAQNLSLSGDTFTVTVPGTTFTSSPTVSPTGVVSAVTGVPTTGSLTMPTFSFTVQNNGGGVASSNGTYTVGIVLDEQGSNRRLEILIPGVLLTFDAGSNLTGTLTTPSVTIYGRDGAGTLTAEVTAASTGSVTFSGNQISFSAADQISFIQAQGGILADITTAVNTVGRTYDYTVILANTLNTNYTFEHSGGMDFPPTVAAEFSLLPASNVAENAVLATNGQKLTGTVTFAATASGGGGGGGGSSVTSNEVSTSLTSAFSFITVTPGSSSTSSADDTPEKVTAAFTTFSTALDNVQTLIAEGGTSPELVSQLVGTQVIGSIIHLSIVSAYVTNDSASSQLAVSTINKFQNTLKSLNSAGLLSAEQLSSLNSNLKSSLATFREAINSQTNTLLSSNSGPQALALTNTSDDLALQRDLAAAIGGLVSELLEAAGVIDNELLVELQQVNNAYIQEFLDEIAESVDQSFNINYENDTATRQLLAENPSLLAAVLDLIAIPLTSTLLPDQGAVQADLVSSGIESTNAQTLAANLSTIANPDGITVDDSNNVPVTATSSIQSSIGLTSVVAYNASTLNISVFDGSTSLRFPINVLSTKVVSDSVPSGIRTLPNGLIVSVSNGLASTMAPAPVDTLSLARGISSANAIISIEDDGAITLASTDFTVSATFGFDGVNAISATSDAPSFSEPVGNPAASDYVFSITYGNGVSQNILPYLQNNAALDAIIAAGFNVTTDRSTGIITILGAGNFRPSYFVEAPSLSDIDYRSANGNGDVVFRPLDENGDGVTDYRVITGDTAQTLYGAP